MRAVVLIALVAACAPEGTELHDWTVNSRATTLPTNAIVHGLPGELPYTLHATVNVPPGEPATLVLPCFHGTIRARVDGIPVASIGDYVEQRFLIGGELTRTGRVELELEVVADPVQIGFGTAPLLVRGTDPRPSSIATFNRDFAIVELAVIVVFAGLFGTSFLLDRRRKQDLAFAIGVLTAAVTALTQLGVLFALGRFAPSVFAIATCGTLLSFVYFLRYSFRLARPPSRLLRASLVALMPLSLITAIAVKFRMIWNSLLAIAIIVFAAYVLPALYREAMRGARKTDARLLLATMVVLLLASAPELLSFAFGRSLYGGIHVLPLGAVGLTIAQAIHLGRDQVTRQKELETTAEELRRQVAERSRELAEVLGKISLQPAPLTADRTIDGRYRVIRKLGAGGMGTVHEVERLSDHQRFALKTVRGHGDSGNLARFAREAQIAAQLEHPNLVPVIDVGVTDGGMYLVMPLVTGGTLEQARTRFGDASWARPLLRQIAKGLAALHGSAIVHRDLKPANILLADERARIADFGLAALRVDLAKTLPSGELADTMPQPLTRAGDIFGTPDYMAPELAGGTQEANPATDIFALGIIAYEMLTGERPFREPPIVARMHGRAIAIPTGKPVDPIVMRCLGIDPDTRPSAAELVNAF